MELSSRLEMHSNDAHGVNYRQLKTRLIKVMRGDMAMVLLVKSLATSYVASVFAWVFTNKEMLIQV
jgi:hypothetical protein